MSIEEEWRPVVGYDDGRYEVSNFGRVRSFVLLDCRVLKQSVSSDGYLAVCLRRRPSRGRSSDPASKRHRVHRLVAAAFIGPCPPDHEVNHIDGVKMNNQAWNLEYVTGSANARHARGLIQREMARLRTDQIASIERLAAAMPGWRIAATLGVPRGVVRAVIAARRASAPPPRIPGRPEPTAPVDTRKK